MKVQELIEVLKQFEPTAEVYYDSLFLEARYPICVAYNETNKETVVLSDELHES